MTQDEIIAMATEAGFQPPVLKELWTQGYLCVVEATQIERFAALVAAHEREKQVEQEPVAWWNGRETAWFEHELDGHPAPDGCTIPLYAAPVRTKDLTDEEIEEIGKSYFDEWSFGFARAAIAKDREKNK